jgi:hypothetical protein
MKKLHMIKELNSQIESYGADQLFNTVRGSQQERSRIVTILPRGEAIRNFVYAGALDEIARQAELHVLSVNPSKDIWSLLASRYENLSTLVEFPEPRLLGNLRELLDMAHGRWLWSEASQERWRLQDLESKGNAKYLKRLAKKMACYPLANRLGLNLLSSVESKASKQFLATNDYLNLFKKIKPSLVFNGSHIHSLRFNGANHLWVAMQAVQAARRLAIPTATFIFSWDNLTSQGRIMPPYDFYFVWSEGLKADLLNMYRFVRPEQVFVTGTPQFDFHFRSEFYWSREAFCARVGADPARPIVLYTTGMDNHMPGEPIIVERIADQLKEMTGLGSPQLLVRVYPKDLTRRFEELKARRTDILFPSIPWEQTWITPKQEDIYLLTNMLKHSSVGINVASTVSLELCMFDKPIINIGYNPHGVDIQPIDYARYYDFDHYKPIVESGAVRLARSEEELRDLLIQGLTNPSIDSANRQRLIREMFGDTLDGRASSRIADYLIELASRRQTI